MSKWIVTLHDAKSIRDLKAAGADELLLSLPFFSLRGAHLFAENELKSLIDDIHAQGLSVAINCTRLFMEDELEELRRFLRLLLAWNVDHIYFADEGVLYEGLQLGMEQCFIYQPDTLITNAKDVAFYLKNGCAAVSLSREITLQEIKQIAKQTTGCELLVHGRFSIMHSRRFLLSNYFNFINKEVPPTDQGDLALQEATRLSRMPIIEDESGTHVFSEYTLQSIAQIKELKESGIQRFRIDSIFHDDAWAIAALQCYREVLDGKSLAQEISARWNTQQEEAYSEGFYYTKTTLVK